MGRHLTAPTLNERALTVLHDLRYNGEAALADAQEVMESAERHFGEVREKEKSKGDKPLPAHFCSFAIE